VTRNSGRAKSSGRIGSQIAFLHAAVQAQR
jgi:hypothetical protein